jgi:hypothetical protein
MAWIRKGPWDLLCSEEPDVAFAFALGLLIPRARPAPLSFPGISFPPREVRYIFWDYREVGYVRRFAFFLLGMVWLDLALGFRGGSMVWDTGLFMQETHTDWLVGTLWDVWMFSPGLDTGIEPPT